MKEFIENVKIYKALGDKLDIYNGSSISVSTKKMQDLTLYTGKPVELSYFEDLEYKYHYKLEIDGLIFRSCDTEDELLEVGLTPEQFKRGDRIWGGLNES